MCVLICIMGIFEARNPEFFTLKEWRGYTLKKDFFFCCHWPDQRILSLAVAQESIKIVHKGTLAG